MSETAWSASVGMTLSELDSPQLLIDLDGVDANLARMFAAGQKARVQVRVHFKSLKCTGLARYISKRSGEGFVCAKLNEAEALVEAGLTDILIANQVIGPIKSRRLAALAQRAALRVCVDQSDNVRELGRAAQLAGTTFGVLVEVDIGMNRCGVEPGQAALELARLILSFDHLRFDGLQGYDGHLQMLTDADERGTRCREGLAKLIATRKSIESAGIPVAVVTGGGTGTWEFVALYPGMTEIQPGSFVLMDAAYESVRPEFHCALSILATVVSRRSNQYVLDAGSKAISRDFGVPVIKGRPNDRVVKLAEEHTIVASEDPAISVGDRFEVYSTHGCATMNLHRTCLGMRKGRVEAVWPIEASGRYD